MGRENQATIKDVAKRAGVSVASAGRALGNYGKISDEDETEGARGSGGAALYSEQAGAKHAKP